MFEPLYDSYVGMAAQCGAPLVPVPLAPPAWDVPWPALEAALASPRAKLLVLNTPHNPTGKVFSCAELERVAALVEAANVYVLLDEV